MAVIREQRQFKIGPIGVARASRGGEITGEAIANAASQWQGYFYQRAKEDAVKAGSEAAQAAPKEQLTTINPETGKPEAYKVPQNFGRFAAEAYQRVIDARYEESMQEEVRLKAKELAVKYKYSPNGYKTAMSDYVSEMSKHASGKYKEQITTVGARYIADTYLNLQEAANSRARAALATSIGNSVDKAGDNAYISAKSGGFLAADGDPASEADLIANKAIADAKNGSTSGVLSPGSDIKATKQMQESIARGGVEYILSGTVSKLERDQTILALRRGDPTLGNLPKGIQDEIKQALRYVTPDNIDRILNHASGVSSDYNAVEADLAAIARDEADAFRRQQEQESRMMDLEFPEKVSTLQDIAGNIAYYGFNNRNEAGELMPQSIAGAFQSVETGYQQIETNLNNRYQTDKDYSKSEWEGDKRDARQAALRPFLLQAAKDGNIDQLKLVLNAEGGDVSKLSEVQRKFLSEVLDSNLYNANEDQGFVNEILSKTKDQYSEELAKMQVQYEISQKVRSSTQLMSNGSFNDEEFDKLISDIRSSIGPNGLTVEQGRSRESQARQAAGIGFVTTFSQNASSQDMRDLQIFIDSNGEQREGMSQKVINAGQEILGKVSEQQDVDAVVSKISGLKSVVSERESVNQEELRKAKIKTDVISGFGNANIKDHRDASQELIDAAGFDIRQFSNYDPETQMAMVQLFTSAPATKFVQSLEAIVSGQAVDGAADIMDLFMNVNRAKGKPFGNSLSDTAIALLQDANAIVATQGGNVNDVVMRLREMNADDKSNRYVAEQIKTKGEDETLESILASEFNNDQMLISEIKPVVEYWLRTQNTLETALSKANTLVDQRYAESKYIVDPRLPLGTPFRSRYALEAVFKDKEDRQQFIQTVESQLPRGYSLNPSERLGRTGQEVETGEKKVYLMPVEGTATPQYYAYYVDEQNELRPLIFERSINEKKSEMVWPMFGPDDIATYISMKEGRVKSDLQQKAEDNQRRQEQLNKSTWEGYYGGIQKQAESMQ